jgi:hypothetical protein
VVALVIKYDVDERRHVKMRTISLKSLALSLILGLGMALVSASGAWAQDDPTRRELKNFHEFLENHPRVAEQLRQTPSLANDRRWVSRHDELEAFLRDHPRIRQELRENPSRVMSWERSHNARADLRKFDRFLDSHPRIADRLKRNPELIRDRQFVENHNELREFLRENPDMRRELQARPQAFMERAARYDRLSRR